MVSNIYSQWPWMIDTLYMTNFFLDVIRQLGWWILIGIGKVLSVVYGAYLGLFKLDLSGIPIVGRTLKAMNGLWPAVLTIFLILACIYILFGNKKVQKELASGVFLSIVLLIITPFIFSTGAGFLTKAVQSVESFFAEPPTVSTGVIVAAEASGQPITVKLDIAGDIINGFVDDNLLSAQKNERTKLSTDIYRVDINEKIGGYFGNADLFPYKILERADNGTMSGKTIKDDNIVMQDQLNEGLYRYNFSFVEPLCILLIMLVGIVLAGLRTAKILFELLFNQTIAPLVFASDPYNAGRTK